MNINTKETTTHPNSWQMEVRENFGDRNAPMHDFSSMNGFVPRYRTKYANSKTCFMNRPFHFWQNFWNLWNVKCSIEILIHDFKLNYCMYAVCVLYHKLYKKVLWMKEKTEEWREVFWKLILWKFSFHMIESFPKDLKFNISSIFIKYKKYY